MKIVSKKLTPMSRHLLEGGGERSNQFNHLISSLVCNFYLNFIEITVDVHGSNK